MKTVNVHEAKTNLSSLLARVERAREEFLICRNGKPIATLAPHRPKDRVKLHPVMSKVAIKYDPTEPLAPNEWRVEG